MLVITRYRVEPTSAADFRDRAQVAIDALAACQGWVRGNVGRAVDDPALWLIATEWENVGTYRRALSAFDVKISAVPLLSEALDEPSAFEVLASGDRGARAADADEVGLGSAAAPTVPTDLDQQS